MVNIGEALRFYKQKAIQNALVRQAKNKEVVGSYGGVGYGKRPDVLQYPGDVLALVQQGMTSFHISEEIWTNPLQLDPLLSKQHLDTLRMGWDLMLDIDCKQWKYSQYAAYYLMEAIKFTGVKSVTVKFSGNHGFHIAIPFEAFPEEVNGRSTKNLFPEAPRTIAEYLRDLTKNHLKTKLLQIFSLQEMADSVNKPVEELQTKGEFNPYKLLDIDTILISSRHLYRMAYSFNEKSGLISVPVDAEKILGFTLDEARPENIVVKPFDFLDRTAAKTNEARQLFIQAYDHKPHIDERKERRKTYYESIDEIQEAIPEQFFPQCIKKILDGMMDGKKRALFILVNFLRNVGWNKEQITEKLHEWNAKNHEPLREVYIKGQLRFDKAPVLPPNCQNEMYYKSIGIQCDENFCRKVKNPVGAAKRAIFSLHAAEKNKREKLTDEQKEMRRQYREKIKDES